MIAVCQYISDGGDILSEADNNGLSRRLEMKNLEIKGRNIVVTGGTSGVGRALVGQFIELGANVATVARNKDGLDQLKREHPQVIDIQGDVSQARDVYPIAGEVLSRLGDVEILVNSASYLGQSPLRLLMDTECEDFAKVFETNVLGPFRLTKALIPSMILRRSGLVVNISSDAAVSAYPTWGSYSVSKAALDHMTRIFAEELKGTNIHFLAVDPGDMNTPTHFAAIPEANPSELKDPKVAAIQLIELIQSGSFQQIRRSL